MTILMETGAVSRGLADISDATEAIASARADATRRVADLMAGWRGEAAESFAAAYETWARAADDVQAQLDALRIGVASASTTLHDSDHATHEGVTRLMDRLG